jgi:hypothetical protein
MAKELSYQTVEALGILGEPQGNWQVEVNMVIWGDSKEAKLDIRKWNRRDEVMGKGITLSTEQAAELLTILSTRV